jgi:hypothetical protein
MKLGLTQNHSNSYKTENQDFGRQIGLVASFFGCWHKDLSRPFTHGNNSYVTCLGCGARKHFDLKRWSAVGSFYFPPDVSEGN